MPETEFDLKKCKFQHLLADDLTKKEKEKTMPKKTDLSLVIGIHMETTDKILWILMGNKYDYQ